MGKIIKKEFIVTIEVDADEVKNKYPNYRFNYSKPEQLIDSVANDIKFIGDVDMSKNGMKNFGYSVKIKKAKNSIVKKGDKIDCENTSIFPEEEGTEIGCKVLTVLSPTKIIVRLASDQSISCSAEWRNNRWELTS